MICGLDVPSARKDHHFGNRQDQIPPLMEVLWTLCRPRVADVNHFVTILASLEKELMDVDLTLKVTARERGLLQRVCIEVATAGFRQAVSSRPRHGTRHVNSHSPNV